jgi:hypothetical protein
MSVVQIINDGSEYSISSAPTLRFYCFNNITTITHLEIFINDARDEYWRPEYDPLPDFKIQYICTVNFASNKPTERYDYTDWIEYEGSGYKTIPIDPVTAYPGQYIEVRMAPYGNWSDYPNTQNLPDSNKFAAGIVYSCDVNNISFAGDSAKIKAFFDVQEMLDEDILNFEPWDGYPVDEHNRPYEKGAWRITNAFSGYPYVCLNIQIRILPMTEYLRSEGNNIPLQRFLKETVNNQVIYNPLIPYFKETIG